MDTSVVHMHGIPDAIPRSEKFDKKHYCTTISTTFCLVAIISLNFVLINRNIDIIKFCNLDLNMHENSFYIELISNSQSFYDNTLTNFKNKISLSKPLNGEWEVALVEISYTKSWKNIVNDSEIYLTNDRFDSFEYIEISNTSIPGVHFFESGVLRSGYYDTPKALCDEIEKVMKNELNSHVKDYPYFTFDNITKLIHLHPGHDQDNQMLVPFLYQEITEILGFSHYKIMDRIEFDHLTFVTERPADITAGIHTLYVYCDIVQPQYIGDTRVKLLRTVEVPSDRKFGDTVVLNYSNPHYIPVLVNEFDSIQIHIKDDSGRDIPFMYGRTKLKLHFRKRDA